jgi:hypothetical protein
VSGPLDGREVLEGTVEFNLICGAAQRTGKIFVSRTQPATDPAFETTAEFTTDQHGAGWAPLALPEGLYRWAVEVCDGDRCERFPDDDGFQFTAMQVPDPGRPVTPQGLTCAVGPSPLQPTFAWSLDRVASELLVIIADAGSDDPFAEADRIIVVRPESPDADLGVVGLVPSPLPFIENETRRWAVWFVTPDGDVGRSTSEDFTARTAPPHLLAPNEGAELFRAQLELQWELGVDGDAPLRMELSPFACSPSEPVAQDVPDVELSQGTETFVPAGLEPGCWAWTVVVEQEREHRLRACPDCCETLRTFRLLADCNNNGVSDLADVAAGTSRDCQPNTIPDECELDGNDCNRNQVPDDCETDCDDNGVADNCELIDCNGNGILDRCDISTCNRAAVPPAPLCDCNGNGVPDVCDLAGSVGLDCNRNGALDTCDLASGASRDANANSVPDECDAPPPPPPTCPGGCNDGNLCTADSCVSGVCVYVGRQCPEGQSCDLTDGNCKRRCECEGDFCYCPDDFDPCNGYESCNKSGFCDVIPPPCPDDCCFNNDGQPECRDQSVCTGADLSGKGTLLVFPKVELKWNAAGDVTQDTFITLTNDYPGDVWVQWYFINGDEPLAAVVSPSPPFGVLERAHRGRNWADCRGALTANEPTYIAISTGLPLGCQPFTVLDPGIPPGRPEPISFGGRMLRGYVIAFAVDNQGNEINWNHLFGSAVIVDYASAESWAYEPYAFKALLGGKTGEALPTPGALHLDNNEFEAPFDKLHLDFIGVGSLALSSPTEEAVVDTDLILLPLNIDLRQEGAGPAVTNATFEIWNQAGALFSGLSRCVPFWDETLLSDYDSTDPFLVANLQSDTGRAQIDGVAGATCGDEPPSTDVPLLGLASRMVFFSFASSGLDGHGIGGRPLAGSGSQPALIQFDLRQPAIAATRTAPLEPVVAGLGPLNLDRVRVNGKGSLLLFADVELKWDGEGRLLEDTFIELSNTAPAPVYVRLQYVNGDRPLDDAEPGWNTTCCQVTLGPNQASYWSAASGLPNGCAPFTALDPGDDGAPGRPDPEREGRRVLRGYLLAWAVGPDGAEISWNQLTGGITHVNYEHANVWEHGPYVFLALSAVQGAAPDGVPGQLLLNGVEYSRPFRSLEFPFFAVGSEVLSRPESKITAMANTDLTLLPVSADWRRLGSGPVLTQATFTIYNQYEDFFSGTRRCIACWDQALLSTYDPPNGFLATSLSTDLGYARVSGEGESACDEPDLLRANAGLFGASNMLLAFSGTAFGRGASGITLTGAGVGDAEIRFDPNCCCDDSNLCTDDFCNAGVCRYVDNPCNESCSEQVVYLAGTVDRFRCPVDPASPSPFIDTNLERPTLNFDLTPGHGRCCPESRCCRQERPCPAESFCLADQPCPDNTVPHEVHVAHSFTDLPACAHNGKLELKLRAAPGQATQTDVIRIGFANATDLNTKWRRNIGCDNNMPGIVNGEWSPNSEQVITLDLTDLPLNPDDSGEDECTGSDRKCDRTGYQNCSLNLLPQILAHRFLDVIVSDDTGVDYMKLTFTRATYHSCTSDADCDDGNPCTDESCVDGVCQSDNNDGACDDGVFCNGADTCGGGACQHAGDPCPGPDGDGDCSEQCNEDHGACTGNDPNGSPCDDGLLCNGVDTCQNGACSQHTGDPCAGGPECKNTCNEQEASCFSPFGIACSDDGNVCTDDVCDGQGNCIPLPNQAPCADEVFCNGQEACRSGVCQPGTNPCGLLRRCEEGPPPQCCDIFPPGNCQQCGPTSCP